MVRRLIDDETGLLAGDWCPHVREEWFKEGSEPAEYCPNHASSQRNWLSRLGRSMQNLFRRRSRDTNRTGVQSQNRTGSNQQGSTGRRRSGRGGG
jgi:hypothetical protein